MNVLRFTKSVFVISVFSFGYSFSSISKELKRNENKSLISNLKLDIAPNLINENYSHEIMKQTLSYRTAVKKTLETHPNIEVMKATIDSTQALARAYWQEYLPKAFVTVDAIKAFDPSPNVIADDSRVHGTNISTGVLINLWDGFKNWYLKREMDYLAQSQEFQKIAIENDLVVKVTEAYTRLYLAQEQINLLNFMKENETKLYQMAKSVSNASELKDRDSLLDLMKLELSVFEGEIAEAETRLEQQINFYEKVVGERPSDLSQMSLDNLEDIEKLIVIPKNSEDAIKSIEENSPQFQSATAEISQAQNAENEAQSEYFGSLNAFVAKTKTTGNSALINPTYSDGFNGGLQYSLTIGAPAYSRKESQSYNVVAKFSNRDSVIRDIIYEIRDAYIIVNQLSKANEAQLVAIKSNQSGLLEEMLKIKNQDYTIDDLQSIFRLIEKLEPNKMNYLKSHVEVILAKATIAAKLGYLSKIN